MAAKVMGDESFSNEVVTTRPTTPDSVPSGSGHASLEDALLNLSGGKRNRAMRYINKIDSNFKDLVDEAGHIRDRIPDAISRLEDLKENVDKWHRGTNMAIAGGSTAAAIGGIGMLFASLFAPATGGASLALAVGVAGTTTAIGGMAIDGLKQNFTCEEGSNIVKVIEGMCKKAESAHKEIKINCELLRKLLHESNPSLSLDENDMYQLSISLACSRFFRTASNSVRQRQHLSVPASAALKSLNVLSKSSVTTVRSVLQTATTTLTTVKQGGGVVCAVSTVAVKNPVVTRVGISTVVRHSSAAVNQGTKVLQSTTAITEFGVTVIADAGDITVSKVGQLKDFITETTKEFAPVLSKVGLILTTVGVIFDLYTAYKAFTDLINDQKCAASHQIAEHIDQLQEVQEQVEQIFDYLQAVEDENNEIEN